ncbi:hypothetical protein [Nostoc sp. 'Peltigera membranacea cyanobiont' 210A]|uniref:hypothetical protein n=1 Tax=Nostoc sp. 'Peltigera membranacea cyanobiont' 210A TaxID=2014529 RepID=UPI00167E6E17|nr:hypothetical protein [Nostoc sp. 'Peltigera membranacea cyanobiont' 210A]
MAQPLVEKGVSRDVSAQVTASPQQELRLNDKSLAGYDMTSLNAIALRFNP